MDFKLSVLFLLALNLGLVSCTQKPNTKELKVSSNFELGSDGFTGGLIVKGVGPSGAAFTATALDGSSISVALRDGTWTFYVVGWEDEIFSGISHCAVSTQTLSSTMTSLNIDVSPENCSHEAFTNGEDAADETGFNYTTLYSCGILSYDYYYDGDPELIPITASTEIDYDFDADFCLTSVPLDQIRAPVSAKIKVPGNLTPGASYPDLEYCSEVSDSISPILPLNAKFPPNKIPVTIELYKESNCQGDALTYEFPNGLLTSPEDFDSIVNFNTYDGWDTAVFLPFNKSLHKDTPLLPLLPSVLCNGVFCPPEPYAGADYVIPMGSSFSPIVISYDSSFECSDVSYTSFSGLDTASPACKKEDGVLKLYIAEDTMGGCNGGTCTFSLDGETRYVQTDDTRNFETISDLYHVLGVEPSYPYILDSIPEFSNNPYTYGVLKDIREELGPDGPLGLFSGQTCNSSFVGEKVASVMNEGVLQLYNVTVKNTTASNSAIPLSFCHNTDTDPSDCSDTDYADATYDKQIIFRELTNTGYKTVRNTYVSCQKKIGMSESYFQNNSSAFTDEQVLIYWNTEDEEGTRLEVYRQDIEYATSSRLSTKIDHRTRYDRLEKSAVDAYYVWTQDYSKHISGTNSEERAAKKEYTTDSIDILHSSIFISLTTPTASSYSLFGTPFAQTQKLIPRLDAEVDTTFGPLISSDYDEYKTGTLTYKGLVFTDLTGEVILKYFNGISWSEYNVTTEGFLPRISINSSGNALIVWSDSSNIQSYRRFIKTSGSFDASEAYVDPSPVSPIINIKLEYFDSGEAAFFYSDTAAYDEVLYKKFDATNWTGPFTINSYAAGDIVKADSLMVAKRSSTEVVITWALFDDSVSQNIIDYAIYNPIAHTMSAVQTLNQTDPDVDPENVSMGMGSDGHLYYFWQDFNNMENGTYLARMSSGSSIFTNQNSGNPINLMSSVNIGDCADGFDLSSTGVSCSTGAFPATLIKPIKSGFERNIQSMNPSTFGALFTPSATFTNIQ